MEKERPKRDNADLKFKAARGLNILRYANRFGAGAELSEIIDSLRALADMPDKDLCQLLEIQRDDEEKDYNGKR